MTDCIISKQISEHCNEPEQLVAAEVYQKLCNGDNLHLGGDIYELNDITESLIEDSEALLEAVQESVTGNVLAIHQLYIKVISELME